MYRGLFQRRVTSTARAIRIAAISSAFVIASATVFAGTASAATLFFTTDATTPIPAGSTFNVDAHIESADVGINAAQATIQFDPTVLNVVSFDTAGSVFGFWLVGPSFSNAKGTLSFIGGATDGFSGQSLQVMHLKMKAIAAGTAKIVFNDAAVTASDGSGTNVLDLTKSLDLTVAGTTESTVPPPASATPESGMLAPASPAGVASPSKPKVTVAEYPDRTAWYNVTKQFEAKWTLPKDVTAVAAVVNANPLFNPTVSIGTVSRKAFPAPPEGRLYLHVRFRNEGGWGETTHYRLGIDLTPPTPVNIFDHGVLPSANPRPIIPVKTTDALSGVRDVRVALDGQPAENVTNETYQPVAPLSPGEHVLHFSARDNAGNVSYTDAKINVVLLGKPIIISAKIISVDGRTVLAVTGTAKPSYTVAVSLKDRAGRELDGANVPVARDGSWMATLRRPILDGYYFVEATAINDAGERSLPVRSLPIKLDTQEPTLDFAGFSFSYGTAGRFSLALSSLLFAISLILFLARWRRGDGKIGLIKKNLNLRFFKLKHDLKNIIDRHAPALPGAGQEGDGIKWDVYSRIDKELRDVHGDIDDLRKK